MSYRKHLMTSDEPPSELYKGVELSTNLAEVGTDCISRQVAISAICSACGKIDCDKMDKCEKLQLPPANCSEFPNNSDTISRAKAIEVCDGYMKKLCSYISTPNDTESLSYARGLLVGVINNIKQLPPIQPERIKGHWIESKGLNILMKKFIEKGETWRVCDKCGAGFMIGYQYECDKLYHETFHNFCPKCGAEMEVTT